MKRADLHLDRYFTVLEMESILLDHLDGGRVPLPPPHSRERRMVSMMIDREWLERHTETIKDGAAEYAVSHSTITDYGRDILARLLGDHAERLTYAYMRQIELKAASIARKRAAAIKKVDARNGLQLGPVIGERLPPGVEASVPALPREPIADCP